jgi:hypothetical protein
MPMLDCLHDQAGGRKARLFACGCCRHVWDSLPSGFTRDAVEAAEQLADAPPGADSLRLDGGRGQILFELGGPQANKIAWSLCLAVGEGWQGAREVAWETSRLAHRRKERLYQVALLHCIVGPQLFRPELVAAASPALHGGVLPAAQLTWNDGCIVRLAEAAYDRRELPGGHLDTSRLLVLADALEEAGCDNPDILAHCRGPGPHVRGCFVVDLLLRKK